MQIVVCSNKLITYSVYSIVIFYFLAPVNVTFEGNLKITEGTFSNLFCSYNDLYPVGNSSIYYIGDVGTKILKVMDIFKLINVYSTLIDRYLKNGITEKIIISSYVGYFWLLKPKIIMILQ